MAHALIIKEQHGVKIITCSCQNRACSGVTEDTSKDDSMPPMRMLSSLDVSNQNPELEEEQWSRPTGRRKFRQNFVDYSGIGRSSTTTSSGRKKKKAPNFAVHGEAAGNGGAPGDHVVAALANARTSSLSEAEREQLLVEAALQDIEKKKVSLFEENFTVYAEFKADLETLAWRSGLLSLPIDLTTSLEDPQKWCLVVLGLGSPTESRSAQWQLAVLLAIMGLVSTADGLQKLIFDPVMTPADTAICEKLGFHVCSTEAEVRERHVEFCASQKRSRSFFYMPGCPSDVHARWVGVMDVHLGNDLRQWQDMVAGTLPCAAWLQDLDFDEENDEQNFLPNNDEGRGDERGVGEGEGRKKYVVRVRQKLRLPKPLQCFFGGGLCLHVFER